MRQAIALLLLTFLGWSLALGPQASKCVSCCPAPRDDGPVLSTLACCGEGCGEKLASGQERPCLTSARTSAAKFQALPVLPADFLPLTSVIGISLARPLWLPLAARPDTPPLRL